jgi:hypothetical protein
MKINENNFIKYLNKGQWKDGWQGGTMDGEGELIYPKDDQFNRVSYNGNYKDSKQSGKGKLIWKDGNKYEGDRRL